MHQNQGYSLLQTLCYERDQNVAAFWLQNDANLACEQCKTNISSTSRLSRRATCGGYAECACRFNVLCFFPPQTVQTAFFPFFVAPVCVNLYHCVCQHPFSGVDCIKWRILIQATHWQSNHSVWPSMPSNILSSQFADVDSQCREFGEVFTACNDKGWPVIVATAATATEVSVKVNFTSWLYTMILLNVVSSKFHNNANY